jgi:hypothetical protein
MMKVFKVGDKIRFKKAYSPEHPRSGRIASGATGEVTYASTKNLTGTRRDVQEHVVTVKLDKRVPALDDQGNEVEFLWYEDPTEVEGDAAPLYMEHAPPKRVPKVVAWKRKVAVPIEVTLPFPRFPVIKAWSFGEKKSGYEVPYFEYPEAKRVATLLLQHGAFTLIDSLSSRETTIYTYRDYGVPPDEAYPPGEPEWGVWEEQWIDTSKGEKKTWAIGAGEASSDFQWKKVRR